MNKSYVLLTWILWGGSIVGLGNRGYAIWDHRISTILQGIPLLKEGLHVLMTVLDFPRGEDLVMIGSVDATGLAISSMMEIVAFGCPIGVFYFIGAISVCGVEDITIVGGAGDPYLDVDVLIYNKLTAVLLKARLTVVSV